MSVQLSDTERKPTADLVRIGVLQNIFQIASAHGADLRPDFRALGYSPDMFEVGDILISVRDVARLLLVATARTKNPSFAIDLAERQDLTFLGSLGLLMQTSETLGGAFRSLEDVFHAHAQPASWTVDASNCCEKLVFALDSHSLSPSQHRICTKLAVAQCYRVIAQITGHRPRVERVHFTSTRPRDVSDTARFYQTALEYESDFCGFELAHGALETKVLHTDPQLHATIRRHLSDANPQAPPPLDRQVRAIIRSLLPTQTLSIERVADRFGCDKRTLQRWLRRDFDTTFNELLEEVRFDLAMQYLSQSNMSVTNLSFALGFSDPTNFSRAFRKYAGCSPREWRNTHKSESRSGAASERLGNEMSPLRP